MLKTTLTVTLITAAQDAFALTLEALPEGGERPPKLTKEQLRELVNAELATEMYDIGNGDQLCT